MEEITAREHNVRPGLKLFIDFQTTLLASRAPTIHYCFPLTPPDLRLVPETLRYSGFQHARGYLAPEPIVNPAR